MEQRYIRVIGRWLWLLILIPIITGVAAFVFSNSQPLIYRAIARLIIGPGISSPNPDFNELRTGALLTQTYVELTDTISFLQDVVDDLELDFAPAELAEIIDIRPIVDTQILLIIVDYTEPETAVRIANRIADGLVMLSPSLEYNTFLVSRLAEQAERIEQDIINIETRIADLNAQLERETDASQQSILVQSIAAEERRLGEANGTLANLYNTLQGSFTNQVEIVDRAIEAVEQSPPLGLTIVIAVGGGAVISVMLVVLLIYLDTLLVDFETIRQYVDYPLWGQVKLEDEHSMPRFLMLSTHFTHQYYYNNIHSILLAGVEEGGHVAFVATNLAKALSKIDKRVLLIDADFSNTIIEQSFGIDTTANLLDILDTDDMHSVVKPQPNYPNLVVIPSGKGDVDSFFRIASRLSRIMGQLEEIGDYVVVAAPSMRSFEQSMAMVGWTDGSIVIAQQNRTRISDLKNAIERLESVGGKVLGLIIIQ